MVSNNIIKSLALPMLLVGAQANAASISFYLDQASCLPNGVNYAQVTISDGVDGDIDFNVSIIPSAFTVSPGDNFGMQSFSFNYDPSLSINTSNIANISPDSWKTSENRNAGGGFGKFEFQLSGNGYSRTDQLSFSITGVSGDTIDSYAIASTLRPSSGNYFAAHIAGGSAGGHFAGSTPVGGVGVVPLPAAAWLFGTGLLGLATVGRRRG